jgi:ABC-2 type transport system ATP-binding protein
VFYSTHILDDVERVSDAVAIVAGGRKLATGPLEDILAAPTASYLVRLRGEPNGLRERLMARPWVKAVTAVEREGLHEWTVDVGDGGSGRLLAEVTSQPGFDVVEFHADDRRLEDAYLEIVGADDGD